MKTKTLLINGASKGIGAEMVRLFSQNEYNVAFTYKRSDKEAAELAKEFNALAIKADSASEDDVISAVKQTIDTFGSIDVLINNAAISSFSLFTDISAQEWKNIFDVNVHGAFYYAREVSREMIKKNTAE